MQEWHIKNIYIKNICCERIYAGNSRLRNRQNFSTAGELLKGEIHGKQRLLEERDEIFKFLNKDYQSKARRRTPINN